MEEEINHWEHRTSLRRWRQESQVSGERATHTHTSRTGPTEVFCADAELQVRSMWQGGVTQRNRTTLTYYHPAAGPVTGREVLERTRTPAGSGSSRPDEQISTEHAEPAAAHVFV